MYLDLVLSYLLNVRFILLVLFGSVIGLFVGAIPGLSVTMATALLVSITYTWTTNDAMATIMGLYVVGVFSGAISAILINIPGAPASVVTAFDGYPLAKRGEAYKTLKYATIYSFIGSVFGILAMWTLCGPISKIALKFHPIDYFLLSLFGLAAVGSLTSKSFSKGLISVSFGLFIAMIGLDSVVGSPRLTFGLRELQAGVSTVPALVGLFGFTEVLSSISSNAMDAEVSEMKSEKVPLKDVLKHFWYSMYYALIGTIVGALPGAGGPVASFLAYSSAEKIVRKPSRPFGEGAIEGIVASETSNNACIGGAMIPMLALAVPGDAVTAIILSVFYVHGLQPGPMFIKTQSGMFASVVAGGLLGCLFLLLLGLIVAPKLSKVILVPKRILLPLVTVLCIIGAFAANNRMFDVLLMFLFGCLGYVMRRRGYPVAPMVLAIVLGGMMDSNFRRAVSLVQSEEHKIAAMFSSPITIVLLLLTILTLLMNVPVVSNRIKGIKGRR
ncbi:MAG: tripartite tricarboxylate transporter permease [Spirochaetales bacterium]|nr:tripartite tricarboxylate transporter permease [Spirochaetales bacterium]